MELGKRYTEKKCKVCLHEFRDSIESDLENGMKAVDVVKKYKNISSANISRHLPHMSFSIPEKLRNIISKKIFHEDLDIESTSALIKLIDFYEKHMADDTNIQYRTQDLGLAIAKKLHGGIKSKEISKVSIDFDLFQKEFEFTNKIRYCENCLISIIKPGDYFNCHGRECGCQGQGNATTNKGRVEEDEN